MICVIDASAIVAVLLSEPERAALIRATKGTELVAPASVHWEIGTALSAALTRRRLTLAQAQRALTAYAEIAIRFVDVDLTRSLRLAAERGIYAYDAYLLTCAQQHQAPLLTLDTALSRTATAIGIDLVALVP